VASTLVVDGRRLSFVEVTLKKNAKAK